MNRDNSRRSAQRGVTLTELIVTLAVASIAATMVFAGYSFAHKVYSRWSNRSDLLNTAFVIQKMLEHQTSTCDSVAIAENSGLVFHNASKGALVLRATEDSLCLDKRPIVLDGARFELVNISLRAPAGYPQSSLLEWHCRLTKKGKSFEWVGGARTGTQ